MLPTRASRWTARDGAGPRWAARLVACGWLALAPIAAAGGETDAPDALWRLLASDDAAEAHQAIDRLSRTARADEFLAARVQPVRLDLECVRRLADDLDARDFRRRALADRELRQMGSPVAAELRRLAEGSAAVEVRARAQRIADAVSRLPIRSAETLQALRAIEVLERVGTRSARAALADIARGAAGAWETAAARAALERLERRPAEDAPIEAPRPRPQEPNEARRALVSGLRPRRSFPCTQHVFDAVFHPDAAHLAGCGSMAQGGVVKLWEIETGREIGSLEHAFAVTSIAFSPDGRLLAAAGGTVPDGSHGGVVVWSIDGDVRPRHLTSGTAAFYRVVFSPDGRWIAGAAHNGQVHVWQTSTGSELLVLSGPTGAVFDVAFSPDGRYVASGGGERYTSNRPGEVQVWELASGSPVLHLEGHTRPVFGVAFSPDSRRLATAAADNSVRLWDVAGGRHAGTFSGHQAHVYGVAFHPDGGRVASADARGEVRFWDPDTQRETGQVRGPAVNRTYRLSFDRHGTQLLAGGPGGEAHLWDVPAAVLK